MRIKWTAGEWSEVVGAPLAALLLMAGVNWFRGVENDNLLVYGSILVGFSFVARKLMDIEDQQQELYNTLESILERLDRRY